jgi:hypothetical protein
VQQHHRWKGNPGRASFEVADTVAEGHGRFYQVSRWMRSGLKRSAKA